MTKVGVSQSLRESWFASGKRLEIFKESLYPWKFCLSKIPGYTENRTGEKNLRAAASETRSFRRSLSGQVALLRII